MIILGLALQLAAATAAPVPAALTVKAHGSATEVPIVAVATATGVTHAVRADLLASALGGSYRTPTKHSTSTAATPYTPDRKSVV